MKLMKKYLKNNGGMALPMVLVIMSILSLLGTAMAVFAYNSFISVRWMDDSKKAYYFARAGVEAASFAYQNAITKTSGSYGDLNNYSAFTDIDKLVTVGQESDEIITTNKVYVNYTNDETGNNMYTGLAFKTYANDDEAFADTSCVGYFSVEIGNGTDKIDVGTGDGEVTEQDVTVKVFKGTAVCGEQTQTVYAYLTTSDNSAVLQLYDENGILSTDSVSSDEASENGSGNKFIRTDATINYDTGEINVKQDYEGNIFDRLGIFFNNLKNTIVFEVFKFFYGTGYDISMYVKTGEGNIILSKPENSKYIKAEEGRDNFYVFATTGNLFLDNVGIDAVPSNGHYASIGLYADQIIIDGDINMELYITNSDSILNVDPNFNALINMLGNRFRLGTVVIGEASAIPTDRRDPLPVSKGGICYKGESVPANKVYFNGNVFLTIYTQGGSTETYRVFNAGDMAYFYGGVSTHTSTDSTTQDDDADVVGIDLVKYFIDCVLEEKDGHIYGETLKNKMRRISELYYGGAQSSYFADDTVLIRKINVDYDANGRVVVDDGYGSVKDILQPTATDSSSLTWGRPVGGDVFSD